MTGILQAGALLAFGVAAVFDLRSRSVPNWLWILPLGLGIIVAMQSSMLLEAYLTATILGAIGFIGWREGALGGADVKGLVTLGVVLPQNGILIAILALAGSMIWSHYRGESPFFVSLALGIGLFVI